MTGSNRIKICCINCGQEVFPPNYSHICSKIVSASVKELLEANNSEVERRRVAERDRDQYRAAYDGLHQQAVALVTLKDELLHRLAILEACYSEQGIAIYKLVNERESAEAKCDKLDRQLSNMTPDLAENASNDDLGTITYRRIKFSDRTFSLNDYNNFIRKYKLKKIDENIKF